MQRDKGIRIAVVLSLVVGIQACSPERKAFARGDRIPFGTDTIAVSYSTVFFNGGSRLIAVPVRYTPAAAPGDLQELRAAFMKSLRLRDAAGKEYACLPMSVPAYQALANQYSTYQELESLANRVSAPQDPNEWMMIFEIPPPSENFTLEITDGTWATSIATVALGR